MTEEERIEHLMYQLSGEVKTAETAMAYQEQRKMLSELAVLMDKYKINYMRFCWNKYPPTVDGSEFCVEGTGGLELYAERNEK